MSKPIVPNLLEPLAGSRGEREAARSLKGGQGFRILVRGYRILLSARST